MTRQVRYELEGLRITRIATAPGRSAELACAGTILAILDRGPRTGETLEAAFRAKEHELGELFARLSLADARALHRRLANPQTGDALAMRFGRLVAERRQRLVAFLADAPRREALARCGRGMPVEP